MEDSQQKSLITTSTQSDNQSFKEKPLQERKESLTRLLEKNPNKIPVIFERHPQSKLIEVKSLKFMSTKNLQLSYFASQIRSTFDLPPECSLFFSTSSLKIIKNDMLIGELYDTSVEADGFLYVQYREVESFGFRA
jgi:GABA(A) receptor-associated protein